MYTVTVIEQLLNKFGKRVGPQVISALATCLLLNLFVNIPKSPVPLIIKNLEKETVDVEKYSF